MEFWIAVALLTLLAVAVIAVPLMRAPRDQTSTLDHDREVYRARLREIDAEVELGRIGEAEAAAAKAEEGRKLIALSEANAGRSGSPPALARAVLVAALFFVPAASVLFYMGSGAPDMPDMAFASREKEDPAQLSIVQLLERAEAQLARNPDDIQGWRVVAPIYLRMGRYDDAVKAWSNALRLDPANAAYMSALGEAMTAAADGVVTDQARGLFEQAFAKDPNDAKARFYLAIAFAQQGDFVASANAWRELIAASPANAPWIEAARQQLASVETRLDPSAPTGAPSAAARPGPSAADVAAASQMSPEDRQSMIETMVAGLAEKLKENPDDKDGWRRLVRSYTVLGKPEEATNAVAAAREHFGDDPGFVAELEALTASARN